MLEDCVNYNIKRNYELCTITDIAVSGQAARIVESLLPTNIPKSTSSPIPRFGFSENLAILKQEFVGSRNWLLRRLPWFAVFISLFQLIIFLISAFSTHDLNDVLKFKPVVQHNDIWRYVSYMLVHSDFQHLYKIILMQCFIAFTLEDEQGRWRVAVIYAMGGLSGSVIMPLFLPQLTLIGASAGVRALLGSHIPHLFKNYSHLAHCGFRILVVGLILSLDIALTIYHVLVLGNRQPRLGWEAHLAGFICGCCLGLLIYKRLQRAGPSLVL